MCGLKRNSIFHLKSCKNECQDIPGEASKH